MAMMTRESLVEDLRTGIDCLGLVAIVRNISRIEVLIHPINKRVGEIFIPSDDPEGTYFTADSEYADLIEGFLAGYRIGSRRAEK